MAARDVGVPLLERGSSFAAWSREFRVMAQRKGLWELITGEELPIEKPQREPPHDEGSRAHEHSDMSDNERSVIILARSKVWDTYERQQERILAASFMILDAVAPSVQRGITHFMQPREMYNEVQCLFPANSYRVREAARMDMDSIEFGLNEPLTALIDKLVECQVRIKEAGGECSDEVVIHRLITCLPLEYDEFFRGCKFPAHTAPDLADLKRQLLIIEPKMRERILENRSREQEREEYN